MPPARRKGQERLTHFEKKASRMPVQAQDVNNHLQARAPSPPKPKITLLHAQGVNSSQAEVHPQDLLRQFSARTGSQQLRQVDQEQGNTRQALRRRPQIQKRAQQLPAPEAPPQATPAPQVRVLHAVVPSPRRVEQRITNPTQRRKQTHAHFEVFQDPPLSPPPQAPP